MEGLPSPRILVDLDCDDLRLPEGRQRCDYVYFDGDRASSRVVLIELKKGAVKGSEVLGQLQEGANIAEKWIPPGTAFRLHPVVVHGKGVHKQEMKLLRNRRIRLRDRTAQALLMRCGGSLKSVLK